MKNVLAIVALSIGLWFFLKNCGSGSAQNLEFEGTWVFVSESELSGGQSEKTSQVWVKGKRFKTVTKSQEAGWNGKTFESEATVVFDGEQLHLKTVNPPYKDYEGNMQTPPPESTSRIPVKGELDGFRFWNDSPRGKKEPGGRVAGRETLLYKDNGARSDAKAINQWWVDAETNLLLRSIQSLFSTQANVSMGKDTLECTSLRFGAVSDNVFAKP